MLSQGFGEVVHNHLAGPLGRSRKRKESVRYMGFFLPEGRMCACLETGVRASGARGGLLALQPAVSR